MKNPLWNNWQAKLVSFLIALVIWGYVKNLVDPSFLRPAPHRARSADSILSSARDAVPTIVTRRAPIMRRLDGMNTLTQAPTRDGLTTEPSAAALFRWRMRLLQSLGQPVKDGRPRAPHALWHQAGPDVSASRAGSTPKSPRSSRSSSSNAAPMAARNIPRPQRPPSAKSSQACPSSALSNSRSASSPPRSPTSATGSSPSSARRSSANGTIAASPSRADKELYVE